MVNVSAFLSKVMDMLLTSGWSGDGGETHGRERGKRMYTQASSHHFRTIYHRKMAVLFPFLRD